MTELNHSQVAEAMWELFKVRPELRSQQLPQALDEAIEAPAVALLLAVTKGGWTAWRAAPEPVRATAAALVMDFFMKLMGDHPSVASRRWRVTTVPKDRQALEVIAQELAASHPGRTRPH